MSQVDASEALGRRRGVREGGRGDPWGRVGGGAPVVISISSWVPEQCLSEPSSACAVTWEKGEGGE